MTKLVRTKTGPHPWVTETEEGGGGGSTSGAQIVRGPFSFAFDTPALVDGISFYVPTIDDILHDVWVDIDTAWDGTTPQLDIGTFDGITYGMFANNIGLVDMTGADDSTFTGLLMGHDWNASAAAGSHFKPTGLAMANYGFLYNGTDPATLCAQSMFRVVPARFTDVLPLKVVVSQDGSKGGADPGAAQGAARIYLITSTPAPLP